ncbi:MAG: DUF4403 family protein [Bacteroidetes bacterium]|nr:DUF4403 family protein [Bacteroidota bacterium]
MKKLLFLIISGVVLSSCATIKPERPVEAYENKKPELRPSFINIPIDANVSDIEKMLNNQLKGLIYEDNSLDDNGGDNLMVKAWKKEDIKLSLTDNVLSYRVPLKLWIKAGWKVGKFGLELSDYREMNAEIALKFKTAITLNANWSITTNTTSDGYEWLSTPVIKIGPVDLPITFIANLILKANQKTINKNIDQGISDNLDIKQYLKEIWDTLQKPVKVNDEYNVWLKVTPRELYSSQLSGKAGRLHYVVGVKSITEAFIGNPPVTSPVKSIPDLKIGNPIGEGFLVNLVADITFEKANELARKFLQGQTFTQGKYHLLINTIDLYGSEGKMVIHLNVSGSLKGDLYFTGLPKYAADDNSIRVESLDYELKTKNALVKTGSWLFHSTLVNMIQKNLVFPLGDQLNSAKALLQESIKEFPLTEGVVLRGSVSDLTIGDIQLTQESILVNVVLKGKVIVTTK